MCRNALFLQLCAADAPSGACVVPIGALSAEAVCSAKENMCWNILTCRPGCYALLKVQQYAKVADPFHREVQGIIRFKAAFWQEEKCECNRQI